MTDPVTDTFGKANATTRKIGEAGAAQLSEASDNARAVMDKNAAAFSETGNSVLAAFQELAQGYQQIASKNSAKLTESFKELGTVKNPVDLVGLQQKLVREAFEEAVADSRRLTEITMSVFTAAFEPMKKNIASMQQAMPQSARLDR